MGNGQQATAMGYTRITPATSYTPERGFGWLHAPAGTFDAHSTGRLPDSLLHSGVWSNDSLVYRADLPDGDYFMTVVLGGRDSTVMKMTLRVAQAQWPDTILMPQYRLPYRTLRRKITVTGGQITIYIKGNGTPAGLYGLELKPLTPYKAMDAGTPGDTAAVYRWCREVAQKTGDDIALANQAALAGKFLLASYYFDAGGWSWAAKKTGQSLIYRMYAAADLLEQLMADPADPLYDHARYLLARIYYWLDQEDDNPQQQASAKDLFEQLHGKYPQDSLIRMYLGEKIADPFRMDTAGQHAPLWAVYQHEAMGRMLRIIHWWVSVRQAKNGEMGGKYGDDVEMLRWWLPAILGADDSVATTGYTRLADGVWNSDQLERGFSRRIDDVEHAAELFRDTHPGMLMIRYGDPAYVERCMISMQNARDVWTGITRLGHRHFRSYYLSATAVRSSTPYDVDVALNARALLPGLWAAWYNRNAAIIHLLGEWGQSWVADAAREANGKPAGVLPSAVAFSNDAPGGHSKQWYAPDLTYDYYDWDHLGHMNELQSLLTGMYALTRREVFLGPLNFYAALMQQVKQENVMQDTAAPGSLTWVKQQLLSGGADHTPGDHPMGRTFAMAAALMGTDRYDTLAALYGLPYNQYVLHRNVNIIETGLERTLAHLRYNFPLRTSEVKFTDRVYIPNHALLSGMYTGHFGAGYEYPALLVSWKHTGKDVAVLVHGGNSRSLQASLHNFAAARTVTMRTWQLEPGIYEVRTATGNAAAADTVKVTERVTDIPLKLPGRRSLEVSVTQLRAANVRHTPKADLALSEKDISIKESPEKGQGVYTVQVTMHNIGNRAVTKSSVVLYVDGTAVDSATVAALEAPDNLQPRTRQVLFHWKPAPGAHVVRIGLRTDQPEITTMNNTAEHDGFIQAHSESL